MTTIDPRVFDEFRRVGSPASADAFVALLIEQFLAEATSRVATLKDAAQRGDAQAMGQHTHSLKGMSGTMGAHGLAAICAELETLIHDPTFDGVPALMTGLEDEFARVCAALRVEQARVV